MMQATWSQCAHLDLLSIGVQARGRLAMTCARAGGPSHIVRALVEEGLAMLDDRFHLLLGQILKVLIVKVCASGALLS